jgi:hypothetical protein
MAHVLNMTNLLIIFVHVIVGFVNCMICLRYRVLLSRIEIHVRDLDPGSIQFYSKKIWLVLECLLITNKALIKLRKSCKSKPKSPAGHMGSDLESEYMQGRGLGSGVRRYPDG